MRCFNVPALLRDVYFLTRLCWGFGSGAFNGLTPCQPRMDQRTLAQVEFREVSKHWCPFTGAELADVNWQSGRSIVVNMKQESHGSPGRPVRTGA